MKLTKSKLKEMIRKEMNEAKREIGGYYLMKQLKDLAQDAKRGGERKVHKALMYLHDRINQSYRDVDLNARDVQDIFNDPRGRKYSKDMPDWMIDSLFEGKMNEAKLKDIVPDIISAARPYTHHTLDHIARRSWDSSDDLIKKIQDYISYPKLRTRFKRDVKKLLKQHSIRESDLPTTTKKDKTVTVVHKTSGKELVVTDTPSTRKKYKRMDYFAQADPRKIKKALRIAKKMGGDMTGAVKKIERIEKDLSNNHKVAYALKTANESINEAKKKVDIEKLSVGNTYKDSRGYPVKIVDINGGGNSWKITYKDGYGKKKIIKTSLRKGVNLYESINEAGMFDDYHKLNRAYMDDFIKNYKKLNRKNVVKKKGDDIYGFRKGEREAHWKYDDNFKLHYDIDKAKVLGLINFFNRAKKDHPWS
jgi:DNA-directed RNA polymerase subunit H (RpoH/RPB5)